MQATAPTSTVDLTPLETVTFLHKAIRTVTWIWETVWENGSIVAHSLIFLFFRVLGFIFPQIYLLEIISCHAIAVLTKIRTKDEIESLKINNEALRKENDRLVRAAIQTEILLDRYLFEKNQAVGERDRAQNELTKAIQGRAALDFERRKFQDQAENLRKIAEEMEITATIANQNTNILQMAKLNLEEIIGRLKRDLQQRESEGELSGQLARIEEAYLQLQTSRTSQWKKILQNELERLLPVYTTAKEAYRNMLKQCIDDCAPLNPARIALAGLIEISERENAHATRISQLIALLKE